MEGWSNKTLSVEGGILGHHYVEEESKIPDYVEGGSDEPNRWRGGKIHDSVKGESSSPDPWRE